MCKAEQYNEKRYIQQESIDARNDLRGARMLRQYSTTGRRPRCHPVRLSVVGTCGVQLDDTVVAEVRRIVSLERETVRARNYNAQSAPEFRFSGLVGLL